jgi:ComF family protein
MLLVAEGIAAQLRQGVHGLVALLLPAACVICRRPHEPDVNGIVCGLCVSRVAPLGWPQCARCGHPRLSSTIPLPEPPCGHARPALPPCRWCVRLHPALRAVRSVSRMDVGTGPDLVHALKYQGWTAVASAMARRMATLPWPADVQAERAALVPIPLSVERLRERGYNQAEVLARALAPAWRIPVWDDVLIRTRHTESQVLLTPSERAGNVSRAFAVPAGSCERLRGRHVVLVDDVVTTSATVNAAVEALLDGGVRIISCATFGRAPDPGDRAAPDYDFLRN